MPHVRDGRLRALGITTLKRSPLAPELPPIADVLPGYESTTWFGLYGPKGLPSELLQRRPETTDAREQRDGDHPDQRDHQGQPHDPGGSQLAVLAWLRRETEQRVHQAGPGDQATDFRRRG